MWEITDPDGRRVVLTDERWEHVLDKHPELAVAPEVVVNTVARPSARLSGRIEGEEWFYRRHAGPSRWIKVVVHYAGGRGFIVTAFPRSVFP